MIGIFKSREGVHLDMPIKHAGTICIYCAKILKEYRPFKNGDSLLGVICDKCKLENIQYHDV